MPAERIPLDVHLDAMTPAERALCDRYVELVEAAGPSEMVVNKSRIAFRAPHRKLWASRSDATTAQSDRSTRVGDHGVDVR